MYLVDLDADFFLTIKFALNALPETLINLLQVRASLDFILILPSSTPAVFGFAAPYREGAFPSPQATPAK
jgi:hypothetical protein